MALRRSRPGVSAFNLVPIVEQVLPDRQRSEVECVSAWERHLYMGTACGLIVYYQLEEERTPLGKTLYRSKVKGQIQLGGDRRKPIQQLSIAHAQQRLLALVDGSLYLMHMQTLELYDLGLRFNKLQCYCVNESRSRHTEPFEVVVASQRRRQLTHLVLSGDKLIHLQEFSIPEPAVAMARDGESLCVGLSSQHNEGRYIVVNMADGGKITDILSYESGATPFVKRTGKGEFLINAGSFGVIAFASGISNRPPVEWRSKPPRMASYVFPYVVSWCDIKGQILVYNLLDQRCVQEIAFANGRYLAELNGKLYAALDRSIYILFAVPLKEQVTDLLNNELVEEAVLLAETITAVEATKGKSAAEGYMHEVKQRAAFIYFSMGNFSQAETLFTESMCDPREVIILFDDLLPSNTSFKPTKGIHGLPSLTVLASMGQLSVMEAKKFLIRYLKDVRTTSLTSGRKEDVDTALVKLLAEDHSPSLVPYITGHDLHLAFEDTKAALETYSCYHALALLYYYSNQASQALTIWIRICDEELKDPSFPGFGYVVDFLSKFPNTEVVLKYSRWALQKNEEVAASIFTSRKSEKELPPTEVLDFLRPFSTATITYLECLIHDRKSESETFHTMLASLYIERVLKLSQDKAENFLVQAARNKLSNFLELSTFYHAPDLVAKIQDTELYAERAVLFGRMEQHKRALDLLVHELKDYSRAEMYCAMYSKGHSRRYRQDLYLTLLAVYLRPNETQETLIRPALSLLNHHGADFDAAQVLELLPPDWPISTVKVFLMHSLRSSIDTSRTGRIEHSLAKGENLQVRHNFIQLQGEPIVIDDSSRCPACNKPFSDAAFVRYPNGIVTHLKCGRNKSICPVTGAWFGD